MAITGIDTIEGKQIIAAGAVSAKSAEMAYNDENGNPITGKLDASASGSLPYAHYDAMERAIVENGITAKPDYLALSGFLTAVPTQISADNLLGVNAGTLTTPQLTADSNGVNATGKGFISTNSTGTASLTYTSGLNIVDNGQGRSASIDGLSGINIKLTNASASLNYSGLNIKHNGQGREISISATDGGKVYIDDKGASGLDGYGNVNWQIGGPAKQLVNAGGDPQPGIIMAPAPTSVSAQWTAMTRVSGNNTGLWAYAGPSANAPYAQFMGQNISIEYAPTNSHAGIGVGDVTAGIYTANNDPDKITWSLTGSLQKREIECDTATSAITAIAGSAIGGGDEFPQSATEAIETVTANSADWNGTTETVSSNSGAWGGSALPISAGPGIKFEMVDNTLVASTDETVLWSGNAVYSNFPLTLNEPMSSFNTVKFYWQTFNYDGKNWTVSEKVPVGNNNYYTLFDGIYNTATKAWYDVAFAFKEENNKLNYVSGTFKNWTANNLSDASGFLRMFKVVGINRIAGV